MSMTSVYAFAVIHVTLANGVTALPDTIGDQEGIFGTLEQCQDYAKVLNDYHASWNTNTDKWYIGQCKLYSVDLAPPKPTPPTAALLAPPAPPSQ